MITDESKEALKEYFKTRKEVAFAFLFSSQARRTATKLSDIDIAVYFYPEKRHPIEYEEEVFYEGEDFMDFIINDYMQREALEKRS